MDENVAKALKLFTEEVARREAGRYQGAVLFGSQARGDQHPGSDVDVAVILSGPAGDFLETALEFSDVTYDILLDTGIRIQVVPLWEEQLAEPRRHNNPRLVENIKRDGIRL